MKDHQKLKKQDFQDKFIRKKIEKACFQHDIAYRIFQYFIRKTVSDKVLGDDMVKYKYKLNGL